MSDSGAVRTTAVRHRSWGARLARDNNVPPVDWYRLRFDPPFFALIAVVSGLFPFLVLLIPSGDFNYPYYVGIYLFLLSLAVLLPLAFKVHTAGGFFPFPAAPFIGLNFLYFVLGTLMLILSPTGSTRNASPSEVPETMLLLAFGFALYAAGVALSGSGVKRWSPKSLDILTVRGMEILVAVTAGVVWVLHLYFATRGVGLSHAGSAGYLALSRDTQSVASLMGHLQFVPVCLCVARLCNRGLPPKKVRFWQTLLLVIVASDVAQFLWIGSRTGVFLEFLIVLWPMWLRLLPTFSLRWYVYAGVVLALAVPVIKAQRAALGYLSPRTGENQLVFTRDVLLSEQARVLQGSAGPTVDQGPLGGEATRASGIAEVSAVADRIYNDGYPLMWGETVTEGLPFLVPRLLWPTKPVQVVGKNLIQRHFALREGDEVNSIEAETLANFGIAGLCLFMFLFGVLTNTFFRYYIKMAPFHEPIAFCLLYALMSTFMVVEIDITSVLGGLRLIPAFFIVLMPLSVRHKRPA